MLAEVQPDIPNFEGWTALASRGEITSRADIGLLVTVDHISGGRLVLGLGAGWYEKYCTTYGYDFGPVKSRFDLFDESLDRIVRRLRVLNPAPVRDIPILIGGSGVERTIPAVAKHADIWHSFLPVERFRKASDVVREVAEANGRKDSDVERSSVWEDVASADAYRDAGVTLFTTEIHPDAVRETSRQPDSHDA